MMGTVPEEPIREFDNASNKNPGERLTGCVPNSREEQHCCRDIPKRTTCGTEDRAKAVRDLSAHPGAMCAHVASSALQTGAT